jgi:N-acetyl-anhydromuramyl-L-alanine amidase AmpD
VPIRYGAAMRRLLTVAVAAALLVTAAPASARPPIVWAPIPYGKARKAEMAAYSLRHYGRRTWHLAPRVIVLHFTDGPSYASARATFAGDTPAPGPAGSAPELPGTCAHFVIDQRGRIYQLVSLSVRCRHTIGLNHVAIGIEMVQDSHGRGGHWADVQILHRRRQLRSALRLVRYLQARFHIVPKNVVGHATANRNHYFRDREGWTNDHDDWVAPDVAAFKRLL